MFGESAGRPRTVHCQLFSLEYDHLPTVPASGPHPASVANPLTLASIICFYASFLHLSLNFRMENRAFYSSTVIILLVALRLSIGWYFFESGRTKNLDRDFSSAGFLSQAKGPLAPLYKSALPDYHRFSELLATPRVDVPNPYPPQSAEWASFQSEPYASWQEQILFDFGRIRQQANQHYQFDEDDIAQADRVFSYYQRSLDAYLKSVQSDIAAYRHELSRLQAWENNASAGDVPYEADRIAAKKRELATTASEFQSAVDAMETGMREELSNIATTPIATGSGALEKPRDPLVFFDQFLMVTHFLIGGCLVIGFLSRFAALSAGLFLVTVIASQPPWIVGYSTIGYQIVMLIGCFLLVATPSGRWCGVDYFLPTIDLTRCCKPKVE